MFLFPRALYLFYSVLIVLFCFAKTALASESSVSNHVTLLGVMSEYSDTERTLGVTLASYDKSAYAGFSFSSVHSEKVLDVSERKHIFPIYAYAGIRAFPYMISPYAEFGVDVGDIAIAYLLKDDDEPLIPDFNYSAGVSVVTKHFRFAAYAKRYHLYYEIRGDWRYERERLEVVGINISADF